METELYPRKTRERYTPCPAFFPTHHIGDRIERLTDVFDSNSIMRYGTVVLRYAVWESGFLQLDYPELYAVKWDNGKCSKGYLSHGITKC